MTDTEVDSRIAFLRRHVAGVVSAQVRRLDGTSTVCVYVTFDDSYKNGAMSQFDGETLAVAARTARTNQTPLVAVMATTGALIGEGTNALDGIGIASREMTLCSGVVPTIAIVDGPVLGAASLILGLFDIVVMTATGAAHLNSPEAIFSTTGIEIEPGFCGQRDHSAITGVSWLSADDLDDAIAAVAELLAYLPPHVDEMPARWDRYDDPHRLVPDIAEIIPPSVNQNYDVRDVITGVVDEDSWLEVKAQWAGNIVIGFATVDGYPVGVVANQPLNMAGSLDIPASHKAGRFVAFCDAFNLPIVTFVDTPGFMPGKDLEWRGMIRHGGQMAFAYARATVPRICITLRKSYGGAYIVMDARTMGNDLSYAWPTAQIAVMGASGAVDILHRKASPEEQAQLIADYDERFMNPYVAAERGYIDDVIHPEQTRRVLCEGLDLLITKRERLPRRPHDNTPL